MKLPNVILLAVVLFASCSKPLDISRYPTLVIDETHQLQASNTPATYQFVQASGIRLETSQFQFKYGTSSITPNMIQVILGKSRLYKLSNPTVTNLYVLDHSTLVPLSDEPFSGFRSGDSGRLMIGRTDPNAKGKESVFVSWVGRFEVK